MITGQVGGVETQLRRLADTGLDVAITELDIRIPKNGSFMHSLLVPYSS